MVQQATGPNKFIIQVTSSATCSDFLLARLTHPRNRMPHFVTSVRLHLGLPVTPTHCNINQCANVPVIPNGEHQSFHARGQINRRHTAVKEVIHHFFQPLFTSGVSRYKPGLETPLMELGFQLKPTAPDTTSAVADIYLEEIDTHHIFVTDVMITFPNQHDPRTTDEPLSAANRGVLAKYTRYVPNYSIAQEDVIPLVFETYGGYAPVTFEFLRRITSTIAKNDAPRAASLTWSLRERIAVALHTAHAKVILALVSVMGNLKPHQYTLLSLSSVSKAQRTLKAIDN